MRRLTALAEERAAGADVRTGFFCRAVDFAIEAARQQAQEHRSCRGGFGAEHRSPAPDAEQAVERWYDEGGNTQTRVARRR